MSSSQNSTLQQIGMVGAAASAIITLLSIKYNDRPFFYEHPKNIPHGKGYPIIGTLADLLKNIHRMHDYQVDMFTSLDTQTL